MFEWEVNWTQVTCEGLGVFWPLVEVLSALAVIDRQGGGGKGLGSAVQRLWAYYHVQPVRKDTHAHKHTQQHTHKHTQTFTKSQKATKADIGGTHNVSMHVNNHECRCMHAYTRTPGNRWTDQLQCGHTAVVTQHGLVEWKLWAVYSVLPGLQALDATEHVQVTSWVLFDHIFYIVRTQCLFELLLGYMEFHYPAHTAEKSIKQAQEGAIIQSSHMSWSESVSVSAAKKKTHLTGFIFLVSKSAHNVKLSPAPHFLTPLHTDGTPEQSFHLAVDENIQCGCGCFF